MFLKEQGVFSAAYRTWMVDWPAVAYVRLSLRLSKSYAGCTSAGIFEREGTRWRAFKQRSRGNVEPAIRWWKKTRSYHEFCPIIWACCGSKEEALVEEARMIDIRKNELSAPYVHKLLHDHHDRKRKMFSFESGFKSRGVEKLVFRTRKLQQKGPWLQFTPARWNDGDVNKVWRSLIALGSKGSYSAEMMQRLFSEHRAKPCEIYLLHRVSGVLEEPFQSFVKGKLRRVMDARGLIRPSCSRPMSTPFLSHEGFKQTVVAVIRDILWQCKAGSIPLHLPCAAMVEARWLTVRDVLFNHKQFMRNFKVNVGVDCVCEQYRGRVPSIGWTACGHVVIRGEALRKTHGVPASAKRLCYANANESIYPDAKAYLERFVCDAMHFFRVNGVSLGLAGGPSAVRSRLLKLAVAEWAKHRHHSRLIGGCSRGDVRALTSSLPGLVWNCEDHKYNRIVGYCPALYSSLVIRTFFESEVFSAEDVTAIEADRALRQVMETDVASDCRLVSATLRKRSKVSLLPQPYIIPKASKGFTTARSVIPCTGNWLRRLHQAVGRVLADICVIVFRGCSFNLPNTQDAVKRLKHFNQVYRKAKSEGTDIDESIGVANRDLAGFFTSVPQVRLIEDACRVMQRLRSTRSQRLQTRETWWTVWLKGPRRQSVQGKVTSPGAVHVPESIIIPVLRHSIEASVCEVGGVVVRQAQGAFIGFPLSAAWCILSVMETERAFLSSLGVTIQTARWEAMTYVDNLLTLYRKVNDDLDVPVELMQADFYGAPVILEDEPDLRYVGLEVDVTGPYVEAQLHVAGYAGIVEDLFKRGSCENFKNEMWRHRSIKSAGSDVMLASAMSGRLHQAARMSFPQIRAQAAVIELFVVALRLNYPRNLLSRLLTGQSRRYPNTYTPSVTNVLRFAISSRMNAGILTLVRFLHAVQSRKTKNNYTHIRHRVFLLF